LFLTEREVVFLTQLGDEILGVLWDAGLLTNQALDSFRRDEKLLQQ
jgi:hypothetical protein